MAGTAAGAGPELDPAAGRDFRILGLTSEQLLSASSKRPKEGGMPFIASNGLTEAGTEKTIAAGGMTVHYHDIGTGEPVLFLHAYGPGTTAWIVFHQAVGELSRRYRCILMDLPNFSKTGPIVYREGVHAVQARTAVALLDALGIG